MDERLRTVVEDNAGYTIEVDDNWHGIEDAKEKLEEDGDAEIVFICITSPFGNQECVGLTLGQAENVLEGLQSLIKALKG